MNPPTPKPPSRDSGPQYVGFECRVCQTRMYARPDQVGRSVKCVDCGATTKIPPPVVKAKRQPAALEGEQYELWDVDAAPLPSELRAAQPTYITIVCRLCQSLLHATVEQVGQQLTCPDCGTKHVVPPPAAPAKVKDPLVADSDVYQLDPAADPGERPPVIVPRRRPMLYEQEADEERERAARDARRGKRPARQLDARGRPILPRWPLVTGIVPFLFSPGAPVRWFALSTIGVCVVGIAAFGADLIGSGGGIVALGYSAIGGFCFLIFGCMLAAIWLAAAASIVLAIIIESSEGNDRVYQWPPINVVEWFPGLMQIVVAGFVSPFPGWLIARFATDDPVLRALAIGLSTVICLPIVLLSQLDLDSTFAVASGRVMASLARCLFTWLMFYLELAALVIGCRAASYYAIPLGPLAPVVLIPLYVAAMLLSARLLGRLGWSLAESTSAAD